MSYTNPNIVKIELSMTMMEHAKEKEVLEQFCLNGADINYQNHQGWSLLFEAASSGDSKFLEEVIKQGSDINMRDNKQRNALFWTIFAKNKENIKVLLNHDISLFVTPTMHALFYAIYTDDIDIVNLLFENGVDINISDQYKRTPIMCATYYKRINIVRFLLCKGADLLCKDIKGDQASDYAVSADSELLRDIFNWRMKYEQNNKYLK